MFCFPLFFLQYIRLLIFFYPRPQGGIFNGGIAVFGEIFKSPPPPPPPPNRKKIIKNSACKKAAFE